jgi:hypothetical protein
MSSLPDQVADENNYHCKVAVSDLPDLVADDDIDGDDDSEQAQTKVGLQSARSRQPINRYGPYHMAHSTLLPTKDLQR